MIRALPILLVACAVDPSGLAGSSRFSDSGQSDGGGPELPDTGLEDSGQTDGGFDAGSEGGFDAGFDDGVDAGFDGGFDAGFDGGFDGGFDAGFDGGFDAGFDGGFDAGFDGGFDGGLDAGFDAGASCTDLFGTAPGYIDCEREGDGDRCEFYVDFSGAVSNCDAACALAGASCIEARQNGPRRDRCDRRRVRSCGGSPNDHICICARPED